MIRQCCSCSAPCPDLDHMLYLLRFSQSVMFEVQGLTYSMSHYSESRLLAGLQSLDPQWVGAIYDQYFSEIYRYIRFRIDNEVEAEDLASEVFMRLLEAVKKRHGPQSSLKGWLIVTASNVVNDHLRRMYRRPEQELPESLPDGNPGIPAEVDAREDRQSIRRAYEKLTPEQQHVLALRFGQGYSLEETADQLKKNTNAVKALQFRALAALRRWIGDVTYD